MKADVFPATVPPRLDIPGWVPDAVARYVSARHAADVDRAYRAALKVHGYFEVPLEYCAELMLARNTKRYLPLACDRRMKGVWRELSRQRDGAFLHPARALRQDAAMLELFDAALACQGCETTTTQRQAEEARDRYLTKADELMGDALMMLVQPGNDKCQERYQKLADAAQAYRDHANEIYATNTATTLKRQHDGRARWVALTISDAFRTLFGSPMYGLTATIASVVLGREITPRAVRQWVHPADKYPRIST